MNVRLKAVARQRVAKGLPGERPIVNLEDLRGGAGKLTGPLATRPAPDMLAFEPGDVLFSKLRPYLAKSLLVEQPMFGTSEFISIVPSSDLDPRFLTYTTLSRPWLDWAVASSYGTKMPRTNWEAMAEYRLELPPLVEQRRIADFLDTEVALLERVVNLRKQQRTVVLTRTSAWLEELLVVGQAHHSRRPLAWLTDPARPIQYGIVLPGPGVEDGVPIIKCGDVAARRLQP